MMNEGRPHISAMPKWVALQYLGFGKQGRRGLVLLQKRNYVFGIIFAEWKFIINTQCSANSLDLLVG